MNDIQLKYHALNVTIHCCIGLIFFGFLIIVLVLPPNKIAGVVFVIILLLIGGPIYFSAFRNFVRLIVGKPSITLNSEYYIDNINDIKIKWTEIRSVGSFTMGHWTFLTFSLIDNSILFRQIRNPIYNLLFRLEVLLTKTSLKTNSSFIDGDNKEIYWTVYNFYKNVQKDTGEADLPLTRICCD